MTDKDFRDAKSACYSLAHSLGNNGIEQNKLVEILHEIENYSDGYNATIRRMLAVFYNGLAYGNWPFNQLLENSENPRAK